MKHLVTVIMATVMLMGLTSCRPSAGGQGDYPRAVYEPTYAAGFTISGNTSDSSVVISTRSPWQGADSTSSSQLLILRGDNSTPTGYRGQVIRDGARRVVCMSSSHVAMLDAIGAVDRVVGVSGIDFISNNYVQSHRDTIADVGYDGNIDYERLVALRPDLVTLYGVNGASVMEPKLRELGIPYVYISEYLEDSPLGKAEWMIAMAEITGDRNAGVKAFEGIPVRYNHYRAMADSATSRPRVMVNVPYGDQWIMSPAGSYMARLIKDAGGDYAYSGDSTNVSQQIDIEEAYVLASASDVWINTGRIATMDELLRALPKFSGVAPIVNNRVWNTTLRSTSNGGNDYWESGVVNPDLVLRDLLMIFHPEYDGRYSYSYYQRL